MKMVPKLQYKESELEILVHLFIENPNENCNIIFNKQWRKCYGGQLEMLRRRANSTTLIEIEDDQWVTFHLIFDFNAKVFDSYIINYIGNDKKYFLENFGFLENRTFFKNYDMDCEEHCNWFYSLHSARMLFKKLDLDFRFLENWNEVEDFMEKVNNSLNQINKLRNKIQVCHKLLLDSLSTNIPIITDSKYALIFFYFTESMALQDKAFQDHVKNYFINIFGKENVEQIQKIRHILLHRKENTVIFPSQFHKYFFGGINCKVILHDLFIYVEKIKNLIEGKVNDNLINEPYSFLECPDGVGNLVDERDIKHILYDYAFEFLKETSYKTFKNPNDIMFNFIMNYIPLLTFLYKKHVFSFSVTQLRNQLVHNIYILQQEDSNLPNICLERMFTKIRDQFRSFYIGYEITDKLQHISSDDCPSQAYENIRNSYELFKSKFIGQFDEGKATVTNNSYEGLTHREKLNYLIEMTEEYLNSLPLVDCKNKISIDSLSINKFNLPEEYDMFSHQQRRSIFFSLMISKILTKEDTFTKETLYSMKELIRLDLRNTGISDNNINSMIYSISHPKTYRDKELVKAAVQHIHAIREMHTKWDTISEVLEDYISVMDGKPIRNEIREVRFKSLKRDNSFLEIDICGKIIYMDLLCIVNNIVTIMFDFQDENNKPWKDLNTVLNNESVLEYIIDENLNKQVLKSLIPDKPELVPLGIKLLKNNCFRKEEIPAFISTCIPVLVSRKIESKYLKDVMHLTVYKNNFNILDEILNYVINNFHSIEKSILNFLFMDEKFISKAIKCIKKAPILSEPISKYYKKGDNNIYEVGKYLTIFTYKNAQHMYFTGKCEKTINDIFSKSGFYNILKVVLEKNIITLTEGFLYKFFISKVYNKLCLFKKHREEAINYHNKALDILRGILFKTEEMEGTDNLKMPWNLRIKCYMAYTFHLLEEHDKALSLYSELSSTLISINRNKNKESDKFFECLINYNKYKSAIRLYPKHLNILTVLYYYNCELEHLGNNSKENDEKMKYYERAISGYESVFMIQREINGIHHDLTKQLMKKIEYLTRKLKPKENWRLCKNGKGVPGFTMGDKKIFNKKKKKLIRKKKYIMKLSKHGNRKIVNKNY